MLNACGTAQRMAAERIGTQGLLALLFACLRRRTYQVSERGL